jgi:hypothetical protein
VHHHLPSPRLGLVHGSPSSVELLPARYQVGVIAYRCAMHGSARARERAVAAAVPANLVGFQAWPLLSLPISIITISSRF